MTSIKEQIETHRAAGYGTEELWRLFDEGKLVPADDSFGLALALGCSLKDYRVAEAVAAERERIADWALEISRIQDRRAKRLGLILGGKHRFAAARFRTFAGALRANKPGDAEAAQT